MALRFTANPGTMAAMTRSEWRVSDLCCGPAPATVYLTFPAAQMEIHTQVTRLVLQSLFLGMLHHRFEGTDGRRKTHRVTWVLDEFPALGHLPFIEDAMAVAAGYGLRLMLVCQDISQIDRTYGRDELITKNCGHLVFATLSTAATSTLRRCCGTMIAPMQRQASQDRLAGPAERDSKPEPASGAQPAGCAPDDQGSRAGAADRGLEAGVAAEGEVLRDGLLSRQDPGHEVDEMIRRGRDQRDAEARTGQRTGPQSLAAARAERLRRFGARSPDRRREDAEAAAEAMDPNHPRLLACDGQPGAGPEVRAEVVLPRPGR